MKNLMLSRLQERFEELVRAILSRGTYNQKELARDLEIPEPNLSDLINRNDDGNYKRKLSATYLTPFIKRRLIRVPEIYDNKPESKREGKYWKEMKIINDDELVSLVVEAEERGLDAKAWLKSYIASVKNSK